MTPPQLVVALDVPDAGSARSIAGSLRGRVDVLKVGLELFTAAGPGFVADLVADGWKVFLDLKLHDIPTTVARTVAAASRLGVDLLTLHASGGEAMLRAAVDARAEDRRPGLLGVTVLTSLTDADLAELGIAGSSAELVDRLAALTHSCGCDGIVASVRETRTIKDRYGDGLHVVAPGIRPAGAAVDDQARVATPADAVRAGASYLVVGRPILGAADPPAAADAIRAEMEAAVER